MMRIALLLLCFFCVSSYAQKCNCEKELQFLESKMELNLPSYQDQVIAKNRQHEYKEHKDYCNKLARKITDSSQCIYLAAKYLSFFRDEHLSINYKDSIYDFSWEDNDTAGMRKFFTRERTFPLPPFSKAVAPEGFWRSRDNKMIVRVVRNKNPLWDYMALVVKGDKKYWSPGQLKFSLKKQKQPGKYEAILLGGSRKPQVVNVTLTDSTLAFGRLMEYYKLADTSNPPAVLPRPYTPGSEAYFMELSGYTNYLRIPSFDMSEAHAIDSLISTNLSKLTSKPNLIIDVRDNEGGSDRSYQALLPLIMDSKLVRSPIAASIFAGPDVIDYYTRHKYEYCETKEDSLNNDAVLAEIQKYAGHFTPAVFDSGYLDKVYTMPAHVAILIDRWCASSTEGFILTAMQSSKVKLYGENTWGMCSYGQWITINIPCLPVAVDMPTKKMNMLNGADYESIGIAPHVSLAPHDKDKWIKQVQEAMEK